MRDLVFDTSSVITISLNNLDGKLYQLKQLSNGRFLITREVKEELVDRPLHGKKYKLEALQINRLIKSNVLEINNKEINIDSVLNLVNNIYFSNGKPIKIISKGELQALILAVELNGVLVVDERTMRMLVEDPESLMELLEKKLHTKISTDNDNLSKFKKIISKVDIIRSCELMLIAYEKGFFDSLGDKKQVLDGLLWGLRLRGCSISGREIDEIEKMY